MSETATESKAPKQKVSRDSPEWRRARGAALKRDQYRCQHCTANPSKTPNVDLQVHHILPVNKGGRHNLNNLVTVCNSCHWRLHKYEDEYEHLTVSILEDDDTPSWGIRDSRPDVEDLRDASQEVVEVLIENGPTQLKDIIEETGYSRGYVQQILDSLKLGKFVCRVRRGVYAYIPTVEFRELHTREGDETGRIQVSIWDPGEQVSISYFTGATDD